MTDPEAPDNPNIQTQGVEPMTVAKVSEILASSPTSFDDAMKIGIARAHKTLRNLKSAWVQSQHVKLDDQGNIKEYRVQLKVAFRVDDEG
jgi:flavin-binding protein dodecin